MTFALAAPALLAAAAGAVDFQALSGQRAELQAAADALATRGAREHLLESATDRQIEAMVRAAADAQYREGLGAFTLTVASVAAEKSVAAELSQAPRKGLFLHHVPAFDAPIVARATAVARGSANVCVVALEDRGADAIRAEASARLEAANCSLLSNSTHASGVSASGFSKLTAKLICSAGGARGSSFNFDPPAVTDCPVFEDPLVERLDPEIGACDDHDLVLGENRPVSTLLSQTLTTAISLIDGSDEDTLVGYTRYDLKPGVYCGGIRIRASADVHLAPGVYVIKDGALEIEFGGRLYGKGVSLFFNGAGAVFTFKPQSIVHLTAPADGLMAGMLMMEDRARSAAGTYSILSANARTLLGTIYLPNGRLLVDSIMPVADASAYTAIVARSLRLSGSPRLVLNTDYAMTDVPVPDGVGAAGGQVFLRE